MGPNGATKKALCSYGTPCRRIHGVWCGSSPIEPSRPLAIEQVTTRLPTCLPNDPQGFDGAISAHANGTPPSVNGSVKEVRYTCAQQTTDVYRLKCANVTDLSRKEWLGVSIPWWRPYLCDPNLEEGPSIGKTFAIRVFRSLTVAFGRETTLSQTGVLASVVSRMRQDAPGRRARSRIGIARGRQARVLICACRARATRPLMVIY